MKKLVTTAAVVAIVAVFVQPSPAADREDSTIYDVVINSEDQYSIWPSHMIVAGEISCDETDPNQNLQIRWGRDNKFHLEQITSSECSPTDPDNPEDGGTFSGSGTGRCNGEENTTIEWEVVDSGRGQEGQDSGNVNVGGDEPVERVVGGAQSSTCVFSWSGSDSHESKVRIQAHSRRGRG